jgi:hypothetical protein
MIPIEKSLRDNSGFKQSVSTRISTIETIIHSAQDPSELVSWAGCKKQSLSGSSHLYRPDCSQDQVSVKKSRRVQCVIGSRFFIFGYGVSILMISELPMMRRS